MQTKYCTVANIKAKVPTLTQSDAEIEVAIELASAHIDSFVGYLLGYNFASGTIDLSLNGTGTDALLLHTPIAYDPATLVLIDNDMNTEVQTKVVFEPLNTNPSDKYKWLQVIYAKTGKFTTTRTGYALKNIFPSRFVVDFTTPANHNLPLEVSKLAEEITALILDKGGIDAGEGGADERSGRIVTETIGTISTTFEQSKTDDIIKAIPNSRSILSKYRMPHLFA